MIGQSGGRISYQVAAVLGTVSLTAAEAHLIMVAIQLRNLRKKRLHHSQRRNSVSEEANGHSSGLSVVPLRAQLKLPSPVLAGQGKNNSVYANCEEPIAEANYSSSDSFDDSSDEDSAYNAKQGRLEISKA